MRESRVLYPMVIEIGRLKVSGTALLVLLAVYFFDPGGMLIAVVSAALVHELGHYCAVRITGNTIAEIKLELCGLTMRCAQTRSYTNEIISTCAGPIASLLFALAAAAVGRYIGSDEAFLMAGVSSLFFLFNTLPVLPLDGGKILFAARAKTHGLEDAERVTCVSSCIVVFLLLIAGMALLIETRVNFSLLIAAVWLLISYCKRSSVSIKLRGINFGSGKWIRD